MGLLPKQSFKWMTVLLQASYHLQECSHEILLFSGYFCGTLMKRETSDILATTAPEQEVSACLQFSQAGIVQENWHQKYFHMYPRKPKLLSFTRLLCWRALLPAWALYLLTYTSGENWAHFQPVDPHPECSPLSWRHLSDASWHCGQRQTPLYLPNL